MANKNCLEGFKCPECKQKDHFNIVGKVTFDVTDDGSEAVGDHEWDDESFCHCPECGHDGTVGEFTGTKPKKKKITKAAHVIVVLQNGEVGKVYVPRGCKAYIMDDDGTKEFTSQLKKNVKGLVVVAH